MQQRHFTSGSRQAPDPYDQFLEEHQYYRKHTARDASCLFRVISEQMYDTQLHHLVIREKCVSYMRKHRKFFECLVDRDFDEYLDDMSKPKTNGTLIELQAAGYLFQRNVFLFEPFNLGNYFNDYRSYFKEVFRVFYTPERHFDSVFTSEYIEEAAICQSICYEILYKDLFKLPDVSFAVEQMLHGPSFDNMEYRTESNEEGYATRLYLNDGRAFELDLPNNTSCILENYKLCHFHYSNFPRFSDDLQRELKGNQNSDDSEKNILYIQRTTESFLPNKYMSCVRQLLQEGITPFPYKVAKALDPNMYRNIEFDSWNEMRKELKLQNWYNGDSNFKLIRYHTRVRKIFQVGAKCHVKLRKSEQDLYTCHIQEIAVDKGQCIVFVEQLGEKRLVPYENLTPLPPDQFKPWTMPYRFQRQMQKFRSVRFTRQYNYRFKFNATTEHHHHMHHQFCGKGMDVDSCFSGDYINEDDDPKQQLYKQEFYKLKRYTHLENFRTHTVEYCTMPLTVEHNGNGGEYCDTAKNGSGQQRGSADVTESSRATSRSSNGAVAAVADKPEVPNPHGAMAIAEEHLCTPVVGFGVPPGEAVYEFDNYNPEAAIFVPELQSFCHMYPYSTVGRMPEDYYGYYGYDGSIAPSPAYMSSMNGGYYYVCSNGPAPPGSYISASANPYMTAPPPAIALQAPPPNIPIYATAPQFTVPPGPVLNCPNTGGASSVGTAQSTTQNSPSPLPPQRGGVGGGSAAGGSNSNLNMCNTPLSGRINYDAKKSFKVNGSDLPNDTHTLRFFYNLGWDYYQQKQQAKQTSTEEKQDSKSSSETKKDDAEQLANEVQAIRLDENGNQIRASGAAGKSDANNNAIGTDKENVAAQTTNTDKHTATVQNSSNSNRNQTSSNNSSAGGNKTNQRRYNSRYFSGKDRQMQHPSHQQYRNNNHMSSNSNLNSGFNGSQQQQQQQQQQHQVSRNQGNNIGYKTNNIGGGHYKPSTTPNSGRNLHQQQQGPLPPQRQQQNPISHPQYLSPNHAAMMHEQGVQGGEHLVVMGGNEMQHCNTPIATTPNNNPYVTGPQGGPMGELINDGLCGGQMAVPFAQPTAGVYVPMSMTSAQGHPQTIPPYPPPMTHCYTTNSGHANFVNRPMHLPPPSIMPGVANSIGSGSDCTDNNGGSDIMSCNGLVSNMTPSSLPPCGTNYPPPPVSYYVATGGGGAAPPAASLNTNGNVNNIHIVPQMAPPTPTNHNMPQPFSVPPHPSMGPPQGYYCLPPPPQPPQMQQMQQPSPMANNNNNNRGVPSAGYGQSTNDPQSNCVRSDISVKND